MRSLRPFSKALLAISVATLVGCSAIESLGLEPRATETLRVRPELTTEQFFSCVESAILALRQEHGAKWETDVTLRDLQAATIETGDYSKSNVIGFRAQASLAKEKTTAILKLKGSGPYYVDLGVSEAIGQLKAQVTLCTQ